MDSLGNLLSRLDLSLFKKEFADWAKPLTLFSDFFKNFLHLEKPEGKSSWCKLGLFGQQAIEFMTGENEVTKEALKSYQTYGKRGLYGCSIQALAEFIPAELVDYIVDDEIVNIRTYNFTGLSQEDKVHFTRMAMIRLRDEIKNYQAKTKNRN